MMCTHEKYELHATCACGADATEKARGQLLQIYQEVRSLKTDLEAVFAEQSLDKLEITTLRLSAEDLVAQNRALNILLSDLRIAVAAALCLPVGSEMPDDESLIKMIRKDLRPRQWG